MKQITTAYRALSVMFVTAYLLIACNTEEEIIYEAPYDAQEKIEVQMSLYMPSAPQKTFAVSPTDENEVRTVDVLAFKADGAKASGWAFAYSAEGQSVISSGGTNNSIKQLTVSLLKDAAKPQKLVVLANVRALLEQLENNGMAVGADKNALLEKLVCPKPGKWNANNLLGENDPAKDFDAFPMWGEMPEGVVIDDNFTAAAIPTIALVRAHARLDVELDPVVIDGGSFRLNEILIYNSKNCGRVVPGAANLDNLSKVKAATEPAGASINNDTPLLYNVPETMRMAFLRTIYLFEAKGKTENQASQATCVVVGGTYAGDAEPTYYRVDFLKKSETESYYRDILRNHHYRIIIKKVSGSGYTSAQEAFESKSMNIVAETVDCDENGMGEIVFDGNHFLGVNKTAFNFPGEARTGNGDDNDLLVLTDYPGGWKVEKIVDAADGTTPADWLTLTTDFGLPASGLPNHKTTIKLTFGKNTGATARSAKIILSAGRLRQTVTVTQNPV